METLRYRFRLDEFDLAGTGARVSWRQGGWVPMAIYAALVAAALAGASLRPDLVPVWVPLVAIVGGLALFPLHARRVLRRAAAGPLFAGPARLRLDAEGYVRDGPAVRSEGRWGVAEDVFETRRHLMIRFGTGSILPVRYADLAPLDPAEAAARIRGWIAGDPGGAPIELVDRIAPGEAGPLIARANRHRPGLSAGRQALFGALGFLAAFVLIATATALGLPTWAQLGILAGCFLAMVWATRREVAAFRAALRRAAPFRGTLEATLSPAGWVVDGDGWRLAGPWSAGVRLMPVRGAVALMLGPSFFVPIPTEALAPHSPADVARHVNRWADAPPR